MTDTEILDYLCLRARDDVVRDHQFDTVVFTTRPGGDMRIALTAAIMLDIEKYAVNRVTSTLLNERNN